MFQISIYCPIRCTQRCQTTFFAPKLLTAVFFPDILDSEASEHLFYCFLPSDSFLDNRIKNESTLWKRRRTVTCAGFLTGSIHQKKKEICRIGTDR